MSAALNTEIVEATETLRSFWSFALHIQMAEPLNQLEIDVVLCEAHSP